MDDVVESGKLIGLRAEVERVVNAFAAQYAKEHQVEVGRVLVELFHRSGGPADIFDWAYPE